MKDIYGDDYLIISRYDYERLLDRIEELEKSEKEYRDFVTEIATSCKETSEKMIAELIHFSLNNEIKITKNNEQVLSTPCITK